MTEHASNLSPTVCVLTPHGRGAIAVVRVDGPGAATIVARHFQAVSGKSLDANPLGRIAFGRWGEDGGEEVVVTRFDGHVEVHCHGGIAASRAIVESLADSGCEKLEQSTWIEANASCPLAAAAHRLLGEARTEKAALVLLDQFNGALRREIEQIVAEFDAADVAAVSERVSQLVERWKLGARLTRPATVVLAGPPNVGKSSLINALVGYERAIVFDQPGTTRDLVTATTAIDGWAVDLIDTAGLREAAGGVEQAGIELGRRAIERADLVLRVAEASTLLAGASPKTRFDEWLAEKQLVEIANKSDLLPSDQLASFQDRAPENLVLTSATTAQGIESLLARIAEAVVPDELPPGSAVPVTGEQVDALREAASLLASSENAAAKQVLLAMLG